MKRLPTYLALTLVSLVLMFPFYWVIISSLKSVEGMNLEPPSLYPAEPLTMNITVPTQGRFFTAEGGKWMKLLDTKDLLSTSDQPGGYFLGFTDQKPTKLVKWFSNSAVKPAPWPTATVVLPSVPVQKVDGNRRALVARMVRQNGVSFDELLFTAQPTPNLDVIRVGKNQPHQDIRFFSPHWDNFAKALKGPEGTIGAKSGGFLLFMRNSLFISLLTVLGQILSSSLVAYGFSRTNFKHRETLFIILIATLMVPGQVTLIPLFTIFKSIGWMDSFWPLIVPHFTAGAFNVFLIRQFMIGLPKELDESAELDGASPFRIYRTIVLPNCKPVLIIVGLFSFVASWQDVMGPLIYLDNPDYRTISLGLEYFRSPYVDNRPLLMAGALLSMLPVAGLFLIAQRYILAGVATSGLKG
jgi:multiple sugar transport system permease protein